MAILESRSYDILRRSKKRSFYEPQQIEIEVYDEGGVNTYFYYASNILFCANGDTEETSRSNLVSEIDKWLDCAEYGSFPTYCHELYVKRVKDFDRTATVHC